MDNIEIIDKKTSTAFFGIIDFHFVLVTMIQQYPTFYLRYQEHFQMEVNNPFYNPIEYMMYIGKPIVSIEQIKGFSLGLLQWFPIFKVMHFKKHYGPFYRTNCLETVSYFIYRKIKEKKFYMKELMCFIEDFNNRCDEEIYNSFLTIDDLVPLDLDDSDFEL
jgi:hypothetical protein